MDKQENLTRQYPDSEKPVFALTPYCRVLSGEAAYINFIVFGLT
jgi:hypothetical protein